MKANSQPSLAKAIRALRAQSRSKPLAGPRKPVPVLIAYGDVPSGRLALMRTKSMLRETEPDGELRPMLWRFNQLDDPRWRDVALRDATRARAVVLAISDESALCPRTQTWLSSLLAQLRGSSVTVLALVGESEAWTITLSQPAAQRSTPPVEHAKEVFATVAPKALSACAA